MNKSSKDLIPNNTEVPFEQTNLIPHGTVLPLEQINHTFFNSLAPNENDERKSISLLLLDSIPGVPVTRWNFLKRLYAKRNDELTKKIPLIIKLISDVYQLYIPKVLEEIILEYLIDNLIDQSLHDEYDNLSLEGWAKLMWSRDFKFPENKQFLNFPYKDGKLQRLTRLLLEEKQYPLMSRSKVRQIILSHILYIMPKDLTDLINEYLGEDKQINREKRYITEIRKFFKIYISIFTTLTNFIVPYFLIKSADKALSAIEENSGFKPFVMELPGFLKNEINFPIKNAFDYLSSIMLTEPVWCMTSKPTEMRVTCFQFIIDNLHFAESVQVKQISQFFYMIKVLVESSRIHAGNLPPNVAYHLTTDMAKSLYIHVDRRLGLGSEIKSLNNVDGNKPRLLTKTLSLLGEEVKDIRFNGFKGFSVIPANLSTGIRLFNYDKRYKPLEILYNYINEPKRSSLNPLSWFSGRNDNDAKTLAIRLLNIPCSGVQEYFLIDEIGKSLLSNGIRDPKYKKALEEVRDVLVKDNPLKSSETSRLAPK